MVSKEKGIKYTIKKTDNGKLITRIEKTGF